MRIGVGRWTGQKIPLEILKSSSSSCLSLLSIYQARERYQWTFHAFCSQTHLINDVSWGASITKASLCTRKSQDPVTMGYLWESTRDLCCLCKALYVLDDSLFVLYFRTGIPKIYMLWRHHNRKRPAMW